MMQHPTNRRPEPSEYFPYFGRYISLVSDGDIQQFLSVQLSELIPLLSRLSDSDSLARHAPYTWSIKQVLGHITDCERVFGFRALWIARGSAAPLTSFDENAFMQAANFDRWRFEELLAEFDQVRRSHLSFFRHLEPEEWLRLGVVNEHPASVRALAYLIAGHAKHHLDILHKRLGA
jgi:uncharacterized damage-inducible protein DinB